MIQFYGRIVIDENVAGGLADNLLSGPGLFGHKNQDIIFNRGDTAESKTLFPAFGIDKLFFFLLPVADMGHA